MAAPVRITTGQKTVEGVGHDLSISGLSVDAPLKVPVGGPVLVAFTLGGVELELEGVVRWRRDDFMSRLGIELGELPQSQAMHLSEFVAVHNLPRTGDTLENLPAVPLDAGAPRQAPLVRPNLEPVRGRRAAVAIGEDVRAATAGPPKDRRETRAGGRTRHYSLHPDDPDG